MLSCCGCRLLHVLGLSFLLLTRWPLFLCPHRLTMPKVGFVLGGPSTDKGTQIVPVEIRSPSVC
uniref:Secreted protein n=1 Tax=Sus scrofa TaxID=9823 RepID=A0A8D1W6S8_PIG